MSTPRRRLLTLLAVAASLLTGCASGGEEAPTGGATTRTAATGGTVSGGGAAAVPEGAEPASALTGVGEADKIAAEWRADARLYTIASLTGINAEGFSDGWLYTYASEEAGAVSGVRVVGGEARLDPEQRLPPAQIQDILGNALPPADRLVDSPEALATDEAAEVREALGGDPGVQASAGLDSFSTDEPVWILTTLDGADRRTESRVPAVKMARTT